MCVYVCPSVSVCVSVSMSVPECLCLYLDVCVSVCVSVCLYVSLSLPPPVPPLQLNSNDTKLHQGIHNIHNPAVLETVSLSHLYTITLKFPAFPHLQTQWEKSERNKDICKHQTFKNRKTLYGWTSAELAQ